MSVEVIRCPSCDHQVRVPESLFGKPVNCPQCRVVFRAPIRLDDGTMGESEVMNTVTPARGASNGRAPSVLGPGIGLILLGVIALGLHGRNVMLIESDPDRVVESMDAQMREPTFQKVFGNQGVSKEEIRDEFLPIMKTTYLVFMGLGVLSLLGGIAMVTTRFYPMAWIGAIAGCVQFPLCCILGLPFGIWGMVKLADPNVRALFRRSTTSES